MKTPLLCLWLALCAGCYTTERLPLRSALDQEKFEPAISKVMREAKAIMDANQEPVGYVASLRSVSLENCPDDFAQAYLHFCDVMAWRIANMPDVTWIRTAAGPWIFTDEGPLRDAALRVKLIAMTYGVTFDR